MDNIRNEYNEYLSLVNEKDVIEKDLLSLSGKNDEDSLKKVNDISKRLGQINDALSLFDNDLLSKVSTYITLMNKYNDISKDIKAIEELSKEGKRDNKEVEFVEISSSEGRKKKIDKNLISEYIKLSEEKTKLRSEYQKSFDSIKNITSMKNSPSNEVVDVNDKKEYVLPEIQGYEDLPIDEKIKMTKERLERIFETGKLPNQGKKVFVEYSGNKYEIPMKYKGMFTSTLLELKKLENIKDGKIKIKPEEDVKIYEGKKEKELDVKVYPDTPVEVVSSPTFKGEVIPKANESERTEKLYESLGVPYDSERQKRIDTLVSELFSGSKELPKEISLKEEIKQKVNLTRGYVTSTSKKVKSYLKSKYNKVKDKVVNTSKELSYSVVNRSVNFKSNTCQRVNESKSKITGLSKSLLNNITDIFDRLRESREDYLTRQEVIATVKRLQEENAILRKENNVLKRILVKEDGFISTAAFIFTTSLLITIIIFVVVGLIVFG